MAEIWFWQRIISPHMIGLAGELARAGTKVKYVAESALSEERRALGWSGHVPEGVELILARDKNDVVSALSAAGRESIHLCQGVRANGIVGIAQKYLAKRKLHQWVLFETVDDKGVTGVAKRLIYRLLFWLAMPRLCGVLAIGHATGQWLTDRGVPSAKIFPFAYFLDDRSTRKFEERKSGAYRFIFVGRFVELKRLPLLVDAIRDVKSGLPELVVVGAGPLEREWKTYAECVLPGRVHWRGRLESSQVSDAIYEADCLVLPSSYDGWGAVISEALMVGVPAVCSDRCGAANAVRASGSGGVFKFDAQRELVSILDVMVSLGAATASERAELAHWAQSLGARAGASYLSQIIDRERLPDKKVIAPWEMMRARQESS